MEVVEQKLEKRISTTENTESTEIKKEKSYTTKETKDHEGILMGDHAESPVQTQGPSSAYSNKEHWSTPLRAQM